MIVYVAWMFEWDTEARPDRAFTDKRAAYEYVTSGEANVIWEVNTDTGSVTRVDDWPSGDACPHCYHGRVNFQGMTYTEDCPVCHGDYWHWHTWNEYLQHQQT